jgi:hypothetical protein
MDHSHTLRNDPRGDRWAWVFRNHVQWHALAYVLSELNHRTGTPIVDQACVVLNKVLSDWPVEYMQNKQSPLWQQMNRLIIRAREVREKDLNSRSSSSRQAPLLPAENNQARTERSASVDFSNISSSDANRSTAGRTFNTNLTNHSINTSFTHSMHNFGVPFETGNMPGLFSNVPVESNAASNSSATLDQSQRPDFHSHNNAGITTDMAIDDLGDLDISMNHQDMGSLFDGLSTQDWVDLTRNYNIDFDSIGIF